MKVRQICYYETLLWGKMYICFNIKVFNDMWHVTTKKVEMITENTTDYIVNEKPKIPYVPDYIISVSGRHLWLCLTMSTRRVTLDRSSTTSGQT